MDTSLKVKQYAIIEVFGPTIQGEGPLIGAPCAFVRFGGCGFRCSWCDTMYAVDPIQVRQNRKLMTAEQILSSLGGVAGERGVEQVILSGGDPVLQLDSHLVETLGQHYTLNVETQGEIYRQELKSVDAVTLSPKGPSSGMNPKWDIWDQYTSELGHKVSIKPVLMPNDPADLNFALSLLERYPDHNFYLHAGTPPKTPDTLGSRLLRSVSDSYSMMIKSVFADPRFDNHLHRIRMYPQLHVMAWPDIDRGV